MRKFIFVTIIILVHLNSEAQKITLQQFLGVSADNLILAGSYNGKSGFFLEDETVLVPKISPGLGIGLEYGIKMGEGILDFGYHFSRASYTSMEDAFSGSSTTHIIRYLGGKMYLGSSAERKFIPYIDMDLSIAFSHFEKIAYSDINPSDIRSANYSGIIFGVGAGAHYMLSKSLVADIRILPEYYMGTDVRSKGNDRFPITKFNNFMLVNSIGLNYFFKEK